jgi:hypothetical protein
MWLTVCLICPENTNLAFATELMNLADLSVLLGSVKRVLRRGASNAISQQAPRLYQETEGSNLTANGVLTWLHDFI